MQKQSAVESPAPGEGLGVERLEREPLGARFGDGGDVEDHDEHALDDQQDPEHLGVEVDLQPAEDADDDHRDQRGYPPLHVDTGVRGEDDGDLEAEDPVDADLHRAVRHQRHERGTGTGGRAEAAGDVRVEGAGVVDVAAHLRVADAEQHQDGAEDDEEEGLPDDAHHAEDRGHHPGDHHQGGAGGEHGEEQAGGAEAVGAQGALLPLVGVDPAGVAGPPGGAGLPGRAWR